MALCSFEGGVADTVVCWNAGRIYGDELEDTTKSFDAQPDGEDASASLSASAASLSHPNSGTDGHPTGGPLAQLGSLPDHLESNCTE